jgi:hypothetical protein
MSTCATRCTHRHASEEGYGPGAGGNVGAVIAEVVTVVAPDLNLVTHVRDARRAHAAMLRRREGLPRCHIK